MGITDEKIQEYMYRKCLIDTVVECVGEEHVYIVNYDDKFIYYVNSRKKEIIIGAYARKYITKLRLSKKKDKYPITLERYYNINWQFFMEKKVELEFYSKKFVKGLFEEAGYMDSMIVGFFRDKLIVEKEDGIAGVDVPMEKISNIKCIYDRNSISLLYDHLARQMSMLDVDELVTQYNYDLVRENNIQQFMCKKCNVYMVGWSGGAFDSYLVNQDDKYIYYAYGKKSGTKVGMLAKKYIDSIEISKKKDKYPIDMGRYMNIGREDFINRQVNINLYKEELLTDAEYYDVNILSFDKDKITIKENEENQRKEISQGSISQIEVF